VALATNHHLVPRLKKVQSCTSNTPPPFAPCRSRANVTFYSNNVLAALGTSSRVSQGSVLVKFFKLSFFILSVTLLMCLLCCCNLYFPTYVTRMGLIICTLRQILLEWSKSRGVACSTNGNKEECIHIQW
jgi:hypothetical protein